MVHARDPRPLTSEADATLARSVGRIWAEGRANPEYWEVRTPVGTFVTDDRLTWRTAAGDWTAELRRSRHGRHVYLALFQDGVYRGSYDQRGWRPKSGLSRVDQLRSYQLPLAARYTCSAALVVRCARHGAATDRKGILDGYQAGAG
jgi:hypothetical protein